MHLLIKTLTVVWMAGTLVSCKVETPQITGLQTASLGAPNGKKGVTLLVKVKNPNAFSLKVKNFDFGLYSGDKQIGRAYANTPIKFKRKAETEQSLFFEIDMSQAGTLLGAGIGAFFSGGGMSMQVKGKMKYGTFIFNKKATVNENISLDLQQLLRQ